MRERDREREIGQKKEYIYIERERTEGKSEGER